MKAIRWAQFRLKQRLEAIDWQEEVLLPEIEKLKASGSVLGLPEGSVIEFVHEDHSQAPAGDSGE
jgi:hypothetical protein